MRAGKYQLNMRRVGDGALRGSMRKASFRKGIARAVPIGAIAGVGAIGMMALMPTGTERANAAETYNMFALEARMPSVISITLDKTELNTVIQPTKTGRFQAGKLGVNVAVSGATEYQVLVGGGGNLVGQTTDVEGITPMSSAATSAEMEANTWGYAAAPGKDADFGNDVTYKAVPEENTGAVSEVKVLGEAERYSASDDYTISFGAKVDMTIPADTYKRTVNISAVAAPRLVASLEDAIIMQDVDATVCAGTQKGVTKQLMDQRDKKDYWVTRMEDGNCWMTQNLQFDIPEGGLNVKLSAMTDVPGSYVWDTSKETGSELNLTDTDRKYYQPTPTKYRMPAAIPEIATNPNDYATMTGSWNLGSYVFSTPATTLSCGGGSGWGALMYGIVACSDHLIKREVSGTTKYYLSQDDARANAPEGTNVNTIVGEQEITNPTGVDAYIDVGATAVGGVKWWVYPGDDFAGAATGTGKTIDAETYTGVAIDNGTATYPKTVGTVLAGDPHIGELVWNADGSESKTLAVGDKVFDAHYLTGNYYQYNAATAGTGTTPDGSGGRGIAVASVCPYNWILPGGYYNATGDTVNQLLGAYGRTLGSGSASWTNDDISYNVTMAPFYFTRAGSVRLASGGGGLQQTWYTFLWSKTMVVMDGGTPSAGAPYASASSVSPSGYSHRYDANSIRCLVKVDEEAS